MEGDIYTPIKLKFLRAKQPSKLVKNKRKSSKKTLALPCKKTDSLKTALNPKKLKLESEPSKQVRTGDNFHPERKFERSNKPTENSQPVRLNDQVRCNYFLSVPFCIFGQCFSLKLYAINLNILNLKKIDLFRLTC